MKMDLNQFPRIDDLFDQVRMGYAVIGTWFDLWMALVNGGGLVLGGLWMRRD